MVKNFIIEYNCSSAIIESSYDVFEFMELLEKHKNKEIHITKAYLEDKYIDINPLISNIKFM